MRRFIPILIAGSAFIALACSDATSPPQQADAVASGSLRLFARPGASPAATPTTESITLPAAGGDVVVGPYTLHLEPDAVCALNSGYGKRFWDAPCTPLGADFVLDAHIFVDKGHVYVDFDAEIRFNPESRVTIYYAVPDFQLTSRKINYWTLSKNDRTTVNEAKSDATLRTFYNRQTGIAFRRIKHFSGYVITSGRECEEGETCEEGGGQ
ncbi:MAG: hypothetical protein WD801_15695 [Gemmatimonadaceae bacterium]